MKFNVILEPVEEGGFNVTVPAFNGCFTQGETIEDALPNINLKCWFRSTI